MRLGCRNTWLRRRAFGFSAVAVVTIWAVLCAGCTAAPRVDEEFPDPVPWFSVEELEIGDEGVVQVHGRVLDSAQHTLGAEPQESGAYPDHVAYGFWPDPTEVGPGDAVEISPSGEFEFEYDFSRPDGVRRGWHVLQFDKADWGTQILWLDIRRGEWSAIEP